VRPRGITGEVGFVPFRYQGQYADIETGLYYNRFRYYDPETGQYTQQDPIGLAGSNPTLYGYVHDTNMWVDPFGLSVFPTDPNKLTSMLGVNPKISSTVDGTLRMLWNPCSDIRIRFESHPDGLKPNSPNWNPRHHGNHYHVETKPNNLSWNQANKQGLISKIKPDGYIQGSGTGFLPGENFPNSSSNKANTGVICKP